MAAYIRCAFGAQPSDGFPDFLGLPQRFIGSNCKKAEIIQMLKQAKGAIVNTSSIMGLTGLAAKIAPGDAWKTTPVEWYGWACSDFLRMEQTDGK